MIRSGMLFLCEKYFSDDTSREKRLPEMDGVYLYSGATSQFSWHRRKQKSHLAVAFSFP
ncbi:hypothetical protein [Photorhabdus thracensis]|uniref:hypothetical protein n=1 Tax=Photorhabdus thracensis TaxID=230089 RepID=UPI000AD212DC